MEPADTISSFVSGFSYNALDDRTKQEIINRIIDSVANAKYSYSELSPHLDPLLSSFRGRALTLSGKRASADYASFYNSFLIRYLDFNDTYLSKEPLHPSDMIGGILALASETGANGRKVIEAIATGYSVGVSLCDSGSLRKRGIDHVVFLGVGAAAAASKLLNLSEKETKNAISLALVPHIALRETRSGSLSMWKGGAAAEAVRNAVFAALLAKAGVTGPDTPFSGKMGLINVIFGGKDFDPSPLERMTGKEVLRTMIKEYPAEYHAQAAIEAALEIKLRKEVKRVRIETYEAAKTILADDRSKWSPQTRETADHSLPFLVSVSLLANRFWLDSYSLMRDPKVLDLMAKVEVEEVEEFTRVYPDKLPVRITVEYQDGDQDSAYREVPKGHYNNPMSRQEIIDKAKKLGLSERAIRKIEGIEEAGEVGIVF
ncbi:MAG: MmgE/PrpD family protein [Nitrososphaeria archaeon]